MHQVDPALEVNCRTYEPEFFAVFNLMLSLGSHVRNIDVILRPYSILARPLVAKYNSRKILSTVTCETVAIKLECMGSIANLKAS